MLPDWLPIWLSRTAPTRGVNISRLQALLHAEGQAPIYTSDVTPGTVFFRAVHWAAQHGFLHDIVDYRTAVLEPLQKRHGLQYSFAYPLHAVEPGKPLDARLRALWNKRLPCGSAPDANTRGEYLQAVYRQCSQ